MRFLADENIPLQLVRKLRDGGFDVLSVDESYGGIADRHVLRPAQQTQTILITQDKDLASIAFRQHAATLAGLILLRLGTLPLEQLVRHAASGIRSRTDWSGLNGIINETAVRIRPLQP